MKRYHPISGTKAIATLEPSDACGAGGLDDPFDPIPAFPGVVPAGSGGAGDRTGSILIVEGDPAILILARHLRGLGYRVTTAGVAAEALQTLRSVSDPFDLAFIDISLLHVSRPSLLRELDRRWPETLPILMTGEGRSEQNREAWAAGVETTIRKPFDPDRFGRFVESLETTRLNRRESASARRRSEAQSRSERWRDAVTGFWTRMSAPRLREIRWTAGTVAALFAIIGLVQWTAGSRPEPDRQPDDLQSRFFRRAEEYLGRRSAIAAHPSFRDDADPRHPARIDQDHWRDIESFMRDARDFLERDENRALGVLR